MGDGTEEVESTDVKDGVGATSIAAAGAPNPDDPEDPEDWDDYDKPKNPQFINDKYLKMKGHNAHAIKEEFFGKGSNARYDIYVDKSTGRLWIFGKNGQGQGVSTQYFIN